MPPTASTSSSSSKTKSKSMFAAPQWVNSLYSKFPLATLGQEDTVDWKKVRTLGAVQSPYTLWVHASSPAASQPHSRAWASNVPSSLRAQLLFLLRAVPIQIRPWSNEAAAPKGKLPALHIMSENRLIAADEIRTWLDTTHPLKGKAATLQGMPNQDAYDDALAVAQLVLVRLLPAYLVSTTVDSKDLVLLLPEPPALVGGLTTPLPASLTGDDRVVDVEDLVEKGVEALQALRSKIGSSWALDAESATPLDALIASHLYCVYALPASSTLRCKLEEFPDLGEYVDRVLDSAGRTLSP